MGGHKNVAIDVYVRLKACADELADISDKMEEVGFHHITVSDVRTAAETIMEVIDSDPPLKEIHDALWKGEKNGTSQHNTTSAEGK